MQYAINNRYGDLIHYQEQLSTGKRILRPSDDPTGVANSLKLRTKSGQLLQFKKNIQDGLAFMGVADTAMNSMNTLFQRLRELAIQASSDTLSENERVYINKETEQLFRQMITLADTKYKGEYIFSGTQTRIPPYVIAQSQAQSAQDYTQMKMAYYDGSGAAIGSEAQLFHGFSNTPLTNIIPGTFSLKIGATEYIENVDYTIDYKNGKLTLLSTDLLADVSPGTANYASGQFNIQFDYVTRGNDIYGNPISTYGVIEREIESGISMPINISADELFTDKKSGIDMIGTLIRFGQHLIQNNQSGIETAIDELDSIFSSLLSAQSENGASINRFETTLDRNEKQHTESVGLLSEIEDTEMAETVSKYMMAENVYNAALKTAARIIQPSLVNFL